MARPPKYNQAMVETICDLTIQGATAEGIAEAVSIHPSTYFDWKANKPEFSEAIKKAEEIRDTFTGKNLAINAIFKAMKNGTWQAGAWWLERKFPAEFRNVQEVQKDYNYEQAREKLAKIIDAKFKKAS